MKRKKILTGILVLILTITLYPTLSSGDDFYNQKKFMPYSDFMGDFVDWSIEDLNLGRNGYNNIYSSNENSRIESQNYGKLLYKNHKEKIDKLILNFDKIIGSTIKKYDKKIRFNKRVANFKYSRLISKSIIDIAYYFYSIGEYDKAVKLILTQTKFGIDFIKGSGGAPLLINGMIGVSIIKLSLNKILWKSLLLSKYSNEEYKKTASQLEFLLKNMAPFKTFLDSEKEATINLIREDLFSTKVRKNNFNDLKNPLLETFLRRISTSNMKYAQNVFIEEVVGKNREALALIEKYKNNYSLFRKKMKSLADKVEKEGKPSIWSIFSPIKTTAKILSSIAFPNFVRAYENYINAKIKLETTILYCKFLAEAPSYKNDLTNFIKFMKTKNIRDYYTSKNFKIKKERLSLILYSVGRNCKDDELEGDDKLIIQLYNLADEIDSYSKGLWEEVVENNDKKAENTYKKAIKNYSKTELKEKIENRLNLTKKVIKYENPLLLKIDFPKFFKTFLTDKTQKDNLSEVISYDFQKIMKNYSSLADIPSITIISPYGLLSHNSIILVINRSKKFTKSNLILNHNGKILKLNDKSCAILDRKNRTLPDEINKILKTSKNNSSLLFFTVNNFNKFIVDNKINLFRNEELSSAPFTFKMNSSECTLKFKDNIKKVNLFLSNINSNILKPYNLNLDFSDEIHNSNEVSITVKFENNNINFQIKNFIDYIIAIYGQRIKKAKIRSCYANLKILEGAREMYLMDNPKEKNYNKNTLLKKLVDEKYIKFIPKCPDGGKYFIKNGRFFCSKHITFWTNINFKLIKNNKIIVTPSLLTNIGENKIISINNFKTGNIKLLKISVKSSRNKINLNNKTIDLLIDVKLIISNDDKCKNINFKKKLQIKEDENNWIKLFDKDDYELYIMSNHKINNSKNSI